MNIIVFTAPEWNKLNKPCSYIFHSLFFIYPVKRKYMKNTLNIYKHTRQFCVVIDKFFLSSPGLFPLIKNIPNAKTSDFIRLLTYRDS